MKIIGQGWQYMVYDIGDGRVLKQRYKNKVEQFLFIRGQQKRKQQPYTFPATLYALFTVNRKARHAVAYLKQHEDRLQLEILGAPQFLDGTSYIQRKATPFGAVLGACSTEAGMQLIEAYIQAIYATWKNGFADITFNFMENYAIDASGNVILSDFGEIATTKDAVRAYLKTEKWLHTTCFKHFPSGALKDYFVASMNEAMSEVKLEELFCPLP